MTPPTSKNQSPSQRNASSVKRLCMQFDQEMITRGLVGKTAPNSAKDTNSNEEIKVFKLLRFHQMFGGLHWEYENEKGEKLSIICHQGSYGWEDGHFETMCSWLPDVQGRLTFGEVQKKINILRKRGLK